MFSEIKFDNQNFRHSEVLTLVMIAVDILALNRHQAIRIHNADSIIKSHESQNRTHNVPYTAIDLTWLDRYSADLHVGV